MTSLRYFYLLVFFMVPQLPMLAQELSAELDSVEIVAGKLLPTSRFASTVDSSQFQLMSWLQIPALSVNALGSSGLSTLSNRGMSSRHTAILFEGVPLNGITTGVFDVSLLPKYFFNQSMLFKEGMASYSGNQTMGGALLLQRKVPAQSEFSSALQYATIHNLSLCQQWSASAGRFHWSAGWESTRDKNQLPFRTDNKLLKSPPFFRNGNNLNGEIFIELGRSHQLMIKSWWQDFEREIPGPLYLPVHQFQQDKNSRSTISHSWFSPHWKLTSGWVYFNESLNFQSPGVDSRAKTTLIQANSTAIFKQRWQVGLTLRSEKVKANFYTLTRTRNSMLISGTGKWKLRRGIINLALAPHLVDGKWMPLHADLRFDYRQFQLAVIRNYNLPGFNDLYWPSGGNPNLKTEKSFQLSAHQLWHPGQDLQIKMGLFSYHVNDFIQWIPAGNNLWTPVNRRKIWSRGGELSLEYRPKWIPGSTLLGANYGYTKATNEDASSNKGKQLIYVPLHKAGFYAKSQLSIFHFTTDVVYLGKRFDTTDHFLSLPSAWVISANLGAKLRYKKIQLIIDYRIENPLQVQYELVRSFPMPLRYHTFNIQFKYQTS